MAPDMRGIAVLMGQHALPERLKKAMSSKPWVTGRPVRSFGPNLDSGCQDVLSAVSESLEAHASGSRNVRRS